jgi:hypothetical protein
MHDECGGRSVTVVYSGTNKHSFIAAYPEEAAMLDARTIVKGWARTGVTWSAWADPADHPGAVPVCEFFGTPGRRADSHLYTADAIECTRFDRIPDGPSVS